MSQPKSANQLYRESNSSLTFAQWLEQSKEDNLLMKNVALTNIIEQEKQKLGINVSPKANTNKIFGLNKNVIIFSSIIIFSAIAYKLTVKK